MKVKELLKMEDSRYPVRQILRWLWRAWRGNRLQAGLNAALGLIGVVISLSQVWAVQHAIDVAAHTIEGFAHSLRLCPPHSKHLGKKHTRNPCSKPHATAHARPHPAFRVAWQGTIP